MAMIEVETNKYDFFASHCDVNDIRSALRHHKTNKIYNLWMSKLKWNGLDEEIKEQQANYIMRKFWSDGTISTFKIKNTELLGFAPYSTETWNMYDFPETVHLINNRGVSKNIIPNRSMVVNKDVVIGYCLPSRKSIQSIVSHYVDRIVEVEMVCNVNLNLQKMPFVISCTKEEEKKLLNTIDKVLQGEKIVVTSNGDLSKLQALVTNAPYLLDKLTTYKTQLENELLTVLGVDNNSNDKTHITMDAIDANNEEINNYDNAIKQEVQFFVDRVNAVFGRNISFEDTAPEVKSVEEGGNEDEIREKNVLDNE